MYGKLVKKTCLIFTINCILCAQEKNSISIMVFTNLPCGKYKMTKMVRVFTFKNPLMESPNFFLCMYMLADVGLSDFVY